MHVFDQQQDGWYSWSGSAWQGRGKDDLPVITHMLFTGTGSRVLKDNGRRAIEGLFERSFGR